MFKHACRSTRHLLSAFALGCVISATAGAQVLTVNGTLGGGPRFDSPLLSPGPILPGDLIVPPTETVDFGNLFYFDSFGFTVMQSGNYDLSTSGSLTFELDPTITNEPPAIFLYLGAFDPQNPLMNLLFGATTLNLDNNLVVPVTIGLTAATPYTLVTSSVFSFDVGPYETTCGPSQGNTAGGCVLSPTNVVPEPSTVVLSASGLMALAFVARRRRSVNATPA